MFFVRSVSRMGWPTLSHKHAGGLSSTLSLDHHFCEEQKWLEQRRRNVNTGTDRETDTNRDRKDSEYYWFWHRQISEVTQIPEMTQIPDVTQIPEVTQIREVIQIRHQSQRDTSQDTAPVTDT